MTMTGSLILLGFSLLALAFAFYVKRHTVH